MPVGLDIGSSGIKICVLDGSKKRPRVTQFVDYRLQPGESMAGLQPDQIGHLIDRLFEKHKIPREGVVVSAPTGRAMLREIQVPFTRVDQIAKTIKFQAESAFHSVSIDDMIVEHYTVETMKDKTRLIVVAYAKEQLERQLDAAAFADIDPIAVDLDTSALFNTYQQGKRDGAKGPTLLIDLGAGSLKVCVMEDGRLRALRSLRAQAASVKVEERKERRGQSVEDLKAGLLAAEREDTFFADDEGRLPVVILDEEQTELFDFDTEDERHSILERVFFEIDRTLARTFLTAPIARVVLTGGGAKTKGITDAFSAHFDAPCARLDTAGVALKITGKEKEAFGRVGHTALGLALKGVGIDFAAIDLRKEEFAYAGKLEKLKSGLACTLVLLFMLFFLLAYRYQIVETDRLYDQQERIVRYQREIYGRLFSGETPRSGSVLASVRQRERKLQRDLGQSVPHLASMLDVFRDFALATRESGKNPQLRYADFRQAKQGLQLIVDDENNLYAIKEKLNAGDYMISLPPGSDRTEKDPRADEIKATIELKLREDDNDTKKRSRGGPPPPSSS